MYWSKSSLDALHHQRGVVGVFHCIACPCVVSTAPQPQWRRLPAWRKLPACAGSSPAPTPHHPGPRLLPIRVPSHAPSDSQVVRPVANDAPAHYRHHQQVYRCTMHRFGSTAGAAAWLPHSKRRDTCIFERKPAPRRCVIPRRAQRKRWFYVSVLRYGADVIRSHLMYHLQTA
ncbi:MAG: hypothetical protein KatS3mg056_1370 [Chloroflexus sp.]|jgi:hypothetical protein|nr:MAG: hypothetical protein KatS3mg056_1370 [Chloroflexus sp.]